MHRNIKTVAKVSALALVAAQIGLTMAYNLPDNPLRQSLEPVLDFTLGTYFSQNWRLFAPDPATSDVSLVVGCIGETELASLKTRHDAGDDVAWEGPWVDITAPLWERHQQSRLSAYDRISRAQANAARGYLQGPGGLESWWRSCKNGEASSCERAETALLNYREYELQEIMLLSSSYCHSTSESPRGVALRIRERKAIPWSQRHEDVEPETADVYLGIYPIYDDVMPAPVYVAS